MKNKQKHVLILHLLLMINSTSGIFSKLAANEEFLSIRFCLFYLIIIILLGIYAIGWQQIIRRLPLTTAFANKSVTVIWGIIWGSLFFHDSISVGKVLGAVLIVIGVVLFAKSDQENSHD
ncbi:MAG: transporter [Eubacteriales bacterium]|nr:transporter [Eubacteriales bacterium]